jgi:hypothetical protein
VASFQVIDAMEDVRVLSQRSRDCPQPAYVLRMAPARVVPPAITVGYERRPHRRAGVTQPVAGGGQ